MVSSADRRYTFSLRQLLAIVTGAAVFSAALAWALKINFWWWASGAYDCSCFFPRVASVAGGTSLAASIAAAIDRRVWNIRSLWLLLPLAVPVVLLCFGVVFQQDGAAAAAAPAKTEQLKLIIEWFPWAIIPIAMILLARFRSTSKWVIIAGVSMAAYWLSFGAQFMSWMSVTDDWL